MSKSVPFNTGLSKKPFFCAEIIFIICLAIFSNFLFNVIISFFKLDYGNTIHMSEKVLQRSDMNIHSFNHTVTDGADKMIHVDFVLAPVVAGYRAFPIVLLLRYMLICQLFILEACLIINSNA